MKIEVLYEDNDILVAVKPYGLPSQPDKKNSENMVSMLKLRIFEKEHRTEEPYLAPIHRLDRPVGGIMLFAKNKEAASKLSKQSHVPRDHNGRLLHHSHVPRQSDYDGSV